MESPTKPIATWPNGIDVLIFCASLALFAFVTIVVVSLLPHDGVFKLAPREKTIFRYGGTTVIVILLLYGTLSFLIGGFIVRRLKRVRARWLSASLGALYSIVVVSNSMLLPLELGSMARGLLAIAGLGFQLFFPAAGLTLGALMLKRSNLDSQPDRPQVGGD